jgi:hypothetical protein
MRMARHLAGRRLLKGFLVGFCLGGLGYSSQYILWYVQRNMAEEGTRGKR